MGQLTIAHNFAGVTDYIIAVPRLSTSPLADVICTINGVSGQTRIAYSAPHSQESILIEKLQNAWYIIKFYSSADGTSLDQELLTLAGNALSDSVYPIIKYNYVVGRGDDSSEVDEEWSDPVEGDHGIRDDRLLNKLYWVEERGTGTLLPVEIVDRSDDGGGFDFADPAKQFWDGGVYFVTTIELADGAASSSDSSGSDYNDVVILSEDTDYDPLSMNSKILIAQWPVTVGTLAIPNLTLIADSKFILQTHGGTQRNVIIQLDTGDTVQFRGQAMNAIVLGKGEWIEIMIKANVMYVSREGTDYARVGRRMFADILELNSMYLDGSRVNITDYPRLDWLLDQLPASEIVSETTWASVVVIAGVNKTPFKGFYTREGGMIRVPDERNMGVRTLKTFDGIDANDTERHKNIPGGYQKDAVGALSLSITGVKIQKSGTSNHIVALANIDDVNLGPQAVSVTVDGGGSSTRGENTGQIRILII